MKLFKGKDKEEKLDSKRNDSWFLENLKRLGIDKEQCEIDYKNSNVNAKEIIYRQLREYKDKLDKVDENKDPGLAYRIKQLVEKFDLLYEYKYAIITRLAFLHKPGEQIYHKEADILKAEVDKMDEKTENDDSEEPIKGSTKWFHNKLMSSKIDFTRLREGNSLDLDACNRLTLFFEHYKSFFLDGDVTIAKHYYDYIENFDFVKYCEECKAHLMEVIGTDKCSMADAMCFKGIMQQLNDRIGELEGNKEQEK